MKKHLVGIIVGFLIVIMLMDGVILYGVQSNQSINSYLQEQQKLINTKAELAFTMREGLIKRVILLRDIFLLDDPFKADDERMRFYKLATEVIETRDQLLATELSEAENRLIDEFMEYAQEGTPIQNEIIDLVIEEASTSELKPLFIKAFVIQDAAIDTLSRLLASLQEQRKQTLIDASIRDQSTRQWIMFISMAATAIALLTATFVVSVHRRQTAETFRERTRFKALFDTNMDAVALIHNDRIVECNQQMSTIFGVPLSDLDGCLLHALSSENVDLSIQSTTRWKELITQHSESGGRFEWVFRNSRNHDFTCEVSVTSFSSHGFDFTQTVIRDISEKKKSQEIMHKQAYYDELTGIANRTQFLQQLSQDINIAQQKQSMLSLLFIDLDRFKAINDTMGHAAGDNILIQVAKRLANLIHGDSTLARLGGDEFTMILPNTNAEEAEKVASTVTKALSQPFSLNGKHAFLGASVGITSFPEHGNDIHTLLSNADIAMYEAKQAGRNTHCHFTSTMQHKLKEATSLENDLRQALVKGGLSLNFQPIVNASTQTIVSVEALIRWHHPKKGLIPPSDFIPIAEESGLIHPISQFVIKAACKQLSEWLSQGVEIHSLSINLPASREFCDFTQKMVSDLCKKHGISPSLLTFEITESLMMDNTEQTIDWLNSLREIGIKLAIDDFGMGYSSLSYLKRFPMDTLKIDKSFIQNITTDEDDHILVNTIIAMAESLGLNIVAEGVETKEQLAIVLAQSPSCSIQGTLFSEPLNTEKCALFIQNFQQENIQNVSRI